MQKTKNPLYKALIDILDIDKLIKRTKLILQNSLKKYGFTTINDEW
ncbi:hypothetical protein P4534_16535 [Peribacillus butanolivorans]|nr:hypothetical protein [Peribacillus butanolivorans]